MGLYTCTWILKCSTTKCYSFFNFTYLDLKLSRLKTGIECSPTVLLCSSILNHKVQWYLHCMYHIHQGGVSQKLSSVTNDSFCYKLLKAMLLIGYQQICNWFLSFVIEKKLVKRIPVVMYVIIIWDLYLTICRFVCTSIPFQLDSCQISM